MSRVAAYVDGAFFQDGTRGLGMSMDLDLAALVASLMPDDEIVERYYYATLASETVYPVRRKDELKFAERFADQGFKATTIPLSLKAHVFIDRGIEAAMSAQMLLDAATDTFDTALILSRRAELAHPIAALQKLGKTAHVSFYEYEVAPGNPLQDAADSYAEMTPAQVLEFRSSGPKPVFDY